MSPLLSGVATSKLAKLSRSQRKKERRAGGGGERKKEKKMKGGGIRLEQARMQKEGKAKRQRRKVRLKFTVCMQSCQKLVVKTKAAHV